jgi:hypothetical protein
MKRLDEIPKKSLFEAPEGYFEKLPGRIQARIPIAIGTKPEPEVAWGRLVLRYTLPVVIIATAVIFVINREPIRSPEEVIATLESEQLVAYLEETDLNVDDLLDAIPLDGAEVDMLEVDALDDFGFDGFDEGNIEAFVDEFDSLQTD